MFHSRPRRAWIPAALALLGACADDLEPAWAIRRFRLFGARLEPPEARPGERVRVELAYVDPVGERPVQVAWVFCAQPRRVGDRIDCDRSAASVLMGAVVDYTVPMLDYGVDPSNRPRVQGLAFACAGTLGLDARGQPACTGPGAEQWTLLRSIVVRLDDALPANGNPTIAEVLLQRQGDTGPGAALPRDGVVRVARCVAEPCPAHGLEIRLAPGAREVYPEVGPDGARVPQAERILFLFAATAGTLDGGFRVDTREVPEGPIRNRWNPPARPGPVTFVFTAQDPRGGFDYATRTILVE